MNLIFEQLNSIPKQSILIIHCDLEKFVFLSEGIYFFCTFRHCHFVQPDKTTEAINSSMRKKELENIYKRKINDSYTYMQLFWTGKNNKQKRSLTKIIKLNKKCTGDLLQFHHFLRTTALLFFPNLFFHFLCFSIRFISNIEENNS